MHTLDSFSVVFSIAPVEEVPSGVAQFLSGKDGMSWDLLPFLCLCNVDFKSMHVIQISI